MMNYCRLPLNFDAAALQSELAAVEPQEWVEHYNKNDFEGDWRGVALRALGGQTGNLRAIPGAQILYEDTPLLKRSPVFAQVLSSFQCPIGTARLLTLAPGSVIREHSDSRLGTESGEVRLHVPIQTHPDVEFYLQNERVVMQAGECWYLDLSLPHRVDNHSPVERVHLVLDCAVNPWLYSLLSD